MKPIIVVAMPSRTLLCAALLASASALAVESDAGKLPPPSSKTGLTYAADVRPLFEASCFRCHGEQRQKGDLRLDRLEDVLKGSEDGKVVLPGDSAKSPLVLAISRLDPDTAMPPMRKNAPGGASAGGPPPGAPPPSPALTAEQVGIVRAWIDQGAK